eukprot:5360219-Pleurochrysis_carterae.AAC.1
MSWSSHASVSAAARLATRSSCLGPANLVDRSDRRTGRQSAGSAHSQTVPRAPWGISCCDTVTVGTLGTCASSPLARARSAASAASVVQNQACTLSAYTPGRKRSSMAMAPPGLVASATSRALCDPGSLGSPGRPRFLRRLPGGCAGWESASPSGMGSLSSWSGDVATRLRREANAGGVTRASSIRARTYADSWGPSVIRPPSTVTASAACGLTSRPAPCTASVSKSARMTFICGG